jgi:hypothetical protein
MPAGRTQVMECVGSWWDSNDSEAVIQAWSRRLFFYCWILYLCKAKLPAKLLHVRNLKTSGTNQGDAEPHSWTLFIIMIDVKQGKRRKAWKLWTKFGTDIGWTRLSTPPMHQILAEEHEYSTSLVVIHHPMQ